MSLLGFAIAHHFHCSEAGGEGDISDIYIYTERAPCLLAMAFDVNQLNNGLTLDRSVCQCGSTARSKASVESKDMDGQD